jgi:AraC-like DNA-binding protein/ligand-binding sensor protein
MKGQIQYILRKDVQSIFDYFTSLLNIRIVYYSPTKEEIKAGLDRPWCRYCHLLRVHLGDNDLCLKMDQEKMEEAREKAELIYYVCHGGLVEAVKPVLFGDSLAGFIMIGQIRTSAAPPDDKIRRWRRRFKSNALFTAYRDVPFYNQSKVESIVGLFSVLVDFIASRHMIQIKGTNALDLLLNFFENNPSEQISLLKAAHITGKSPSHLSHLLKKDHGKSFKQIQADFRLKKVEEIIRSEPGVPIKEIAFRLGFNDPLYFSRFYRKHRGYPPSMQREQMRNGKQRAIQFQENASRDS